MIFHESCVVLNTMHKRFLLKIKGNCTIFLFCVEKKIIKNKSVRQKLTQSIFA